MTDMTRLAAALTDRYRLERELGQGGMATVYLAQDLKHHRKVAVKVLRPELAATLGSERFFREIEVAAQLQHPHILPLLDSGETEGFYYYVMPYVAGESLRERLAREGELPIHDAVKILSEVVDALAAAHALGVVHRDIKPDNVMLSGRHALVMDFGVAKAVSEATGRNRLTTAGVALGTPAYMAPEQAAAEPHLDHRVDIYATGALGYELLTGRPPFTGMSSQEILAAHVTKTPDPVTAHRAACPPALAQVIMRCLEKRPADRWQTAEELLAQLEPLATPSGGMTPTQTRPTPAVPSRGVPRWGVWVAAAALLAVGLALALGHAREPQLTVGKRIAVGVGPAWEQWPSLSPDGKTVVYQLQGGDAPSHLVVQQVDGGSPMVIGPDVPGLKCCAALSPDGARLLYLSVQGLQIMPTLGGQVRQVAAGSWFQSVSGLQAGLGWGTWSPDGGGVAYTQRDTLFVQRLDQSPRSPVATGRDLHSPAWSPDGRWIALVSGNSAFHLTGNLGSSAIEVVPAGGGKPIPVTDGAALNTSPVWIAGGRTLLFISDRDGGRDIYQVSLGGDGKPKASPVRITTGLSPNRIAVSADGRRLAWSAFSETSNVWSLPVPTGDSVPLSRAAQITTGTQTIETAAISPDGRWLYYDSDIAGNSDIWRMPPTGGQAQQLTTYPAGDFNPAPSPDGRELAFHSFRSGNRDIFVMPSDGGPVVQVTSSPEHDLNPKWFPDGQRLVFDRQLTPDSSLWSVRRRPDGVWETPTALPYGPKGALPRVSPKGRWVAFSTPGGLEVMDLAGGGHRRVVERGPAVNVSWPAWSDDGQSLFYARWDSLSRVSFNAVGLADGRVRTLAYTDDLPRQLFRYGLTASRGRLYFPLIERKADVWVAQVERR